MPPDLHPDLEALAPLLGTWAGRGSGKYPTIQPFDYFEEVVFSHVGKPFLAYSQKTKAVTDGKPLHAETGYLRAPRPGEVELVLAHPSGITEIEVGTYSVTGDRIDVELSTGSGGTIGLTPTAKEVTALGRSLRIDGDELSYKVRMGAVGQPLQDHLDAVLHRRV
ncbi:MULTISPECIES: peroxynitrite isomerase [unclassified Mycobacterium]|uniref:peroxynitrite isomerase n=1 Tax=unclassified Mycobacterium TaxID=2642494 RepID=UPI0007FDD742|nr:MULTISPECIES: FABP family protein [unclassified Mycobacterium]OBH02242.1 fatty acid-binding-like protein [Mycobacterium sp. E2699]OBI53654.1 fatty acid-binding-like protein [Mycobacterium sp. E787]